MSHYRGIPLARFPLRYLCPRAAGLVEIDGRLDDPAWARAPWTPPFVDILGPKAPAPRFETRVKMLWDDVGLLIGARLEEADVWGTITRRDAVIFHDNDFEVFLDPDDDGHLYAEIEINALGTVWDLLLVRPYRADGPPITGWDLPGLETAVEVTGTINRPGDQDEGWSVEMRLPWAGLSEISKSPVPPRGGDRWRINFSRVQWPHEVVDGAYRKPDGSTEDNWVWSPQGVVDMHRPERWGVLEFVEAPGDPGRPFPDDDLWARLVLQDAAEALREGRPLRPIPEGELELWRGKRGYEIELRLGGQTWTIDHELRFRAQER